MVAIRSTSSVDPEVDEDVSSSEGVSGGTVKVVVTGFGPFRTITDNPSFKIAQGLPSEIILDGDEEVTINVLAHPKAVEVVWQSVLDMVPQLYDEHAPKESSDSNPSEIDGLPLFIHIGAGAYGEYTVEKRAHRDGYTHTDEDGKEPPLQNREHTRSKEEDDEETVALEKRGYPIHDKYTAKELRTSIDLSGVAADVNAELPDLSMPLRISDDAGLFLCDFIYYTSLHEAMKRWGPDGRKQVLFVHVPPDGELDEGIQLVTAVIRSVIRHAE